MDDFLVLLQAELLLDLDRFEPFDPCQGIGGEVHESFGEFLPSVEATDCISRIERHADVQNAEAKRLLPRRASASTAPESSVRVPEA